MRLSLTEAAHRLRMTVTLLEWFARYSPKRDGRKLQIGADRRIDEAEILAFDAYLWERWDDKNPGVGILREIARESRGRCGLCRDQSDAIEAAHIDRLDEELKHHCQHPHNLINLCSNCHTRYDVRKTITNDTIKHAKRQLISQLMEDVDRDVGMALQLQAFIRVEGPHVIEEHMRTLVTKVVPLDFIQNVTAHAETVVTGSASAPPVSSGEARERLAALSGSISEESPFTSRLLLKYESSIAKGELPSADIPVEELIDDRPISGKCLRCHSETPMDTAACSECGEDAGHHDHVTARGDGTYELGDIDHRGEIDGVVCDECGSDSFDVEFMSMCDYCEHMADKIAHDD